jgi:hypothetical protein
VAAFGSCVRGIKVIADCCVHREARVAGRLKQRSESVGLGPSLLAGGELIAYVR